MRRRGLLYAEVTRLLPVRLRLRHALGGAALLFLGIEIVTGILLMAYYRPTVGGAFFSMGVILDEVRLGWLVRSLHAWSADFLVLLALLHLTAIYFAHAYRAPRQLNWTSGIVLLLTVYGFILSGILLPWDQYAYWATEAARQGIAGVPVIGTVFLGLLWGGWQIGEEVLLRFYVFHVALLPWLLTAMLLLHLFLGRRFADADRYASGAESAPHAAAAPVLWINMLIGALLACGVVLSAATLYPPMILEQADPLSPLSPVRPHWYFLPAHRVLSELSGKMSALVVLASLFVLLMIPVVDGQPSSSSWRKGLRWIVGIAGLAVSLLLGFQGYAS